MADLGDGSGLHVAGQRLGEGLKDLLIFLQRRHEPVAGADEPAVHRMLRPQGQGRVQQGRIRVELLRQPLHLAGKIALAAPHVVVGRPGSQHHIAHRHFRRQTTGTAGIDDAVGVLREDQLRSRARRGRFPDAGLHHVRHAGPAQRFELFAHRDDQTDFHTLILLMDRPLNAGFLTGEDALRQLHGDDDAEYDGHGHLGRAEAAGERRRQLSGHQIIGAPEDAGSRHEGEDAAEQEDLRGAFMIDGGEARQYADQHGRQDDRDDRAHGGEAHQHQVQAPADGADQAGGQVLRPGHAEQAGEGERTEEGRERLGDQPRRLGIDAHPLQDDHAAEAPAVQQETEGHAQRDAEEAEHRVRQARDAGDIVGIGQVPHAVHEGNAGDQGHDGADDHVAETAAKTDAIEQQAEESSQQRIAYPAHDLGQEAAAEEQDIGIQERAHHERGGAVQPAAAENGAEAGGSQRGPRNQLPVRLRYRLADEPEALLGLLERADAIRDVITQPVDGHDLGQLDAPDGDKLHIGVGLRLSAALADLVHRAGGEDAVAEHEETARVDAVMRRDAGHDILHARDFGSVLQQDVPCFRRHFQHFGQVGFLSRFHHNCKDTQKFRCPESVWGRTA